jgi:ribosomal protein S18 acetylase RimI-like enzyme
MIEKQLIEKYGEYLDQLDISETNTSLRLSMIKVKPEYRYNKSNQGDNLKIGSKVMSDLIRYADANFKIITLTPDNIDGVSVNALTQFYKKFGFKMNKGHNKNFYIWT